MLKKLFFWPFVIINILLCIGFLISGYSYLIPPAEHPNLSLLNFTFPFFAIGVIAFMVLWVLIKWKYAFISILTLIIGYTPMHKYAPITPPDGDTTGTLKIISYNVHCFSSPYSENDTANFSQILDYLKKEDADIVCLQEAYLYPGKKERLEEIYKYVETYSNNALGIAVTTLSKTPIEKVEGIDYDTDSNISACFYVRYKDNTLRIMSNHLESIKLTLDDKKEFKSYVKGALEEENQAAQEGTLRIANHIKKATVKRQSQAEVLSELIGDNPKNTILLGDFNDTPLSYSHYLINQKLTDCYSECGWLTGFSYVNNGMYVRIDHTFCSDDFKTVKCYVDKSANFSDHNPMITYLIKEK